MDAELRQELHKKTAIVRLLQALNINGTVNISLTHDLLNLCPKCSKFLDDTAAESGSTKFFEVSLEQCFGIFLIICGFMAASANLLVLIAVGRHLLYKNALFLIITNFAIIDQFKALCAIYMGSVLMGVSGLKTTQLSDNHDRYLLVFKMLQTSVFMMYFGNLCSVFNLILATVNEFLCIKLPLKYKNWVTKYRVAVAILITWILAFIFSLLRALHSGGGSEGWSNILVPINNQSTNKTYQHLQDNLQEHDSSQWSLLRSQNNGAGADTYALILLSSLLFCLVIVSIVYINLYLTIKRSVAFRTSASVYSSHNIRPSRKTKKLMNGSFGSIEDLEDDDNVTNSTRPSVQRKITTTFSSLAASALLASTPAARIQMTDNFREPMHKAISITYSDSAVNRRRSTEISRKRERSSFNVLSPSEFLNPIRTLELIKKPQLQRLGNQVSILKRHRTVLVILVVCLINFVYLTIYFSLQLLHVLHVRKGVTAEQLRQRYVINFILRALFVLHASLNPIIFFRIRSFRTTFQNMFFSCRKCLPGSGAIQRGSNHGGTMGHIPGGHGTMGQTRRVNKHLSSDYNKNKSKEQLQKIDTSRQCMDTAENPLTCDKHIRGFDDSPTASVCENETNI